MATIVELLNCYFVDQYFTYLSFCLLLFCIRCSALAQTFMNIMVKSVQKKHNYSGVQAFMGMTIVCTLLTAGVVVSQLATEKSSDSSISSVDVLQNVFVQFTNGEQWPLQLTLLASLAYHIEYALNFIFSGYVSNVSFSVSDIARRICIIIIGSVMFSKTLTTLNCVGIVIAIGGVLWYTYLNDLETKRKNESSEAAASKEKSE